MSGSFLNVRANFKQFRRSGFYIYLLSFFVVICTGVPTWVFKWCTCHKTLFTRMLFTMLLWTKLEGWCLWFDNFWYVHSHLLELWLAQADMNFAFVCVLNAVQPYTQWVGRWLASDCDRITRMRKWSIFNIWGTLLPCGITKSLFGFSTVMSTEACGYFSKSVGGSSHINLWSCFLVKSSIYLAVLREKGAGEMRFQHEKRIMTCFLFLIHLLSVHEIIPSRVNMMICSWKLKGKEWISAHTIVFVLSCRVRRSGFAESQVCGFCLAKQGQYVHAVLSNSRDCVIHVCHCFAYTESVF